MEWVAYPFSRESSCPRNQTGVSCIAGRFFTNWAIREALISELENKYEGNKDMSIFFLFLNFPCLVLMFAPWKLVPLSYCPSCIVWQEPFNPMTSFFPQTILRHTFSLEFYLQDLCEQIWVSIIFINLPRPKKEIYSSVDLSIFGVFQRVRAFFTLFKKEIIGSLKWCIISIPLKLTNIFLTD